MHVGDGGLLVTARDLETALKAGPSGGQMGEGEGRFTSSCGLLPRIQQAGFPQNSREGPRMGMGAASGYSVSKSLSGKPMAHFP